MGDLFYLRPDPFNICSTELHWKQFKGTATVRYWQFLKSASHAVIETIETPLGFFGCGSTGFPTHGGCVDKSGPFETHDQAVAAARGAVLDRLNGLRPEGSPNRDDLIRMVGDFK